VRVEKNLAITLLLGLFVSLGSISYASFWSELFQHKTDFFYRRRIYQFLKDYDANKSREDYQQTIDKFIQDGKGDTFTSKDKKQKNRIITLGNFRCYGLKFEGGTITRLPWRGRYFRMSSFQDVRESITGFMVGKCGEVPLIGLAEALWVAGDEHNVERIVRALLEDPDGIQRNLSTSSYKQFAIIYKYVLGAIIRNLVFFSSSQFKDCYTGIFENFKAKINEKLLKIKVSKKDIQLLTFSELLLLTHFKVFKKLLKAHVDWLTEEHIRELQKRTDTLQKLFKGEGFAGLVKHWKHVLTVDTLRRMLNFPDKGDPVMQEAKKELEGYIKERESLTPQELLASEMTMEALEEKRQERTLGAFVQKNAHHFRKEQVAFFTPKILKTHLYPGAFINFIRHCISHMTKAQMRTMLKMTDSRALHRNNMEDAKNTLRDYMDEHGIAQKAWR
jgi:hypothetical protein